MIYIYIEIYLASAVISFFLIKLEFHVNRNVEPVTTESSDIIAIIVSLIPVINTFVAAFNTFVFLIYLLKIITGWKE